MNDEAEQIAVKLDRLAEQVVNRFSSLDQRMQGLEGEAAEIVALLRAVMVSLETLQAKLSVERGEPIMIMEYEDDADGFFSPLPGQFLH